MESSYYIETHDGFVEVTESEWLEAAQICETYALRAVGSVAYIAVEGVKDK